MRFIAGLFIGSSIVAVFGFANAHARYREHADQLIELDHKRIIAVWEKEQAEKKAADLAVLLDTLRRAEANPVYPKGPILPAGDLIPAPAVPFPVEPAPLPALPGNPAK